MKVLRYEDLLKGQDEPEKSITTDIAEELEKGIDADIAKGPENGIYVETAEDSDKESNKDKFGKSKPNDIKGRRKSGKFWKDDRKRASSMVKTKGLRLSLEKKKKMWNELKHIKEMSKQLVQNRKDEKAQKRLRRKENLRRREENQKKAEVVQVIKNPAKIKRMRRKQLRKIEKRDISKLQKK